jgi:hypothetical protein
MSLNHARCPALTPRRQEAWIGRKCSKGLALYQPPATNTHPGDHVMKQQKLFCRSVRRFVAGSQNTFHLGKNGGLSQVVKLSKLFISLYVRQRTASLGTPGDNDCQEQKAQTRILLKLCAKLESNTEGRYYPTAVSNKQQQNASPRSRF